jgi:sulfur relay (sulfurtransferase) complex TusBCD TusD component (DsrE family)
MAALVLVALNPSAQGQTSVTLAWDPSPGSDIAGYRLYEGGASRTYTNVLDLRMSTNGTFSALISGATYFFAATAYSTNGLESDYSPEVSYTVPLPTNNSPAITLTSSANGSAYVTPAAINLAASVTANGHAITQVQFYNGATLLGSVASAPYTWSWTQVQFYNGATLLGSATATPYNFLWTNVSAGNYSLTAHALYDSGSTVASTAANVTVADLPLPSIALTSPANGASYLAPATINLAASVTTNGHSITQVQFYNGATLLGTVTETPCSFSWTNISAGSYSLTAQAVFDSGSTISSAPASVTVNAKKHPRLRISTSTAATVQPPPPLTILDASDGDPGLTYTLQFSPDLSTWIQIDAMILDANGCCHLTNSVGPSGVNGFYRMQGQ